MWTNAWESCFWEHNGDRPWASAVWQAILWESKACYLGTQQRYFDFNPTSPSWYPMVFSLKNHDVIRSCRWEMGVGSDSHRPRLSSASLSPSGLTLCSFPLSLYGILSRAWIALYVHQHPLPLSAPAFWTECSSEHLFDSQNSEGVLSAARLNKVYQPKSKLSL